MYSSETQARANRALPILVSTAKARGTLTYGDLAQRIGCHPRAIGAVLGYLLYHVTEPRGLPLLTCIVLLKGSTVPGWGFLPNGEGRDLTPQQLESRYLLERDRVYAYPHWDDLI